MNPTYDQIKAMDEPEKEVLRIYVNRTLKKIASAERQIESGIIEGDVK